MALKEGFKRSDAAKGNKKRQWKSGGQQGKDHGRHFKKTFFKKYMH